MTAPERAKKGQKSRAQRQVELFGFLTSSALTRLCSSQYKATPDLTSRTTSSLLPKSTLSKLENVCISSMEITSIVFGQGLSEL